MTCRCGGHFCFACGDEWPCKNASCSDTSKPKLAIDVKLIRQRRAERRHAVLMGGRCGDECALSRMPPDVLRLIAEKIS